MKALLCFLLCMVAAAGHIAAQDAAARCTDNPARSWWHAERYDIDISVDTATGYIRGEVRIGVSVTGIPADSLQIDLAAPLQIKEAMYRQRLPDSPGYAKGRASEEQCRIQKQGAAHYISGGFSRNKAGDTFELVIVYEGQPTLAKHAPWDGGMVLDRDPGGKRWIGMACQGTGASVWFPCKDFQGAEPDQVRLTIRDVPQGWAAIGNGKPAAGNGSRPGGIWSWQVRNPINLYDISFYIGDYVHWSDTLHGEKGKLDLDYYVLRGNLAKAKRHFKVVKPMLRCFEEKLGPYPFYEDGYKLVEAPYLGMEHQSAVAYGNHYRMGYDGTDRSGTGVGMAFDFIIVHESGHEWFGNSITAYDKADTWVHEGLTTYAETIFAECLLGRYKAFAYQQGKKQKILNDRPVQGVYGQCDEGSGDHYDKAGFLIHMIRLLMDDDGRFYAMLREMNREFYHRIVTGKEIEQFISRYSGTDFTKVFDQYLRSTAIPQLEWRLQHGELAYRWTNCVPGFDMPVQVRAGKKKVWLKPATEWKTEKWTGKSIQPEAGFLVSGKRQ